jgi:hypothetical protein
VIADVGEFGDDIPTPVQPETHVQVPVPAEGAVAFRLVVVAQEERV